MEREISEKLRFEINISFVRYLFVTRWRNKSTNEINLTGIDKHIVESETIFLEQQ